jgi:hypothetical protein
MEKNIKILKVVYDKDDLPTIVGNINGTGFNISIQKVKVEEILDEDFKKEFDESLGCSIHNGIAYLIDIMFAPFPIKIDGGIGIEKLADSSEFTGNKLYVGLPVIVYMHMLGQLATEI